MASNTVGTAVIKLSFDGSDVKAELSKTSSQFKQAGTEAGSAFGSALTVAMGSLISKGVSKVINSLTSNLDSAINRVDVINNFPKVMESLGFSTDEAAASIKVISSRLDGLPSTLNGVVGDVQKLTATMGNLNKGMVNATSLGLALNDMFLAGGKGTEAASNAMEQYNQMLAQGKPDMQSWRSMLNAAPGQLKQLAKSLLGATANQQDLYQALMDGVITFDQMNEAIVRLDQQGGDGFDSFERQARAATGGIGTAMENVQNRISKAIAKVIEAIGSENISNAINGISSGFEGIGVEVGKFVKGAMQGIGEFVRFIQNNTWVLDVVKGAIASLLAIGIGRKIMDLKDKVMTLFAAISAHPLAAFVTAIIGVGTAIASAVSHENDLTKAIKSTTEACNESVRSWENLTQSRQETLNRGMSELSYYEQLKKELGDITDENGRVQKGYEERAKFIVGKLSDALGIEIKMQDGVIQQHHELQTQIDKTIEKKKAELKLKAQEEAYTEAIQGRIKASKRMAEIEAEIREAMATGTNITRIPELAKAYDEQEKLVSDYAAAIKGYEADLAAFTEERYEDMSNAAWNWVDDLIKAEQADAATLQKAVRETEISLNTNKRLYEKTGDEIYKTEARKDDERLSLLKTKLGAYNSATSSGLNTAKNTWNSALGSISNSVWNQGGNMLNAGANLVNSLANGERRASANAISAIQNTANSMSWVMGSQYGNMFANGQNLVYGVRDGWNSRASEIVHTLANRFVSDFGWILGIHSPSTVFRDKIGVMLARGLGIGFVNEMDTVTGDMAGAIPMSFGVPAYATNWSSSLEGAIMEQSSNTIATTSNVNVYMNNTIDNGMSVDELGRKFTQSIRRYA